MKESILLFYLPVSSAGSRSQGLNFSTVLSSNFISYDLKQHSGNSFSKGTIA